jgi:response regulator RpfG family c-di-GMP phosphodiesterase
MIINVRITISQSKIEKCICMSESPHCPEVGRILFIDKNITMRKTMNMVLKDQFQIVTADSAEAGLALVESDPPFDIVISGFTLICMNGLELLRRVGEICPQTVRILMSGGCGDAIKINRAISAGYVSRLILKPFCMSSMKNQLKNDLATARARLIAN